MFRRRTPRIGLAGVVYLVIGVVIASSHHYFNNANTWRSILSAALAIVLWPLILLGISLHVHR
jgi:membrane-bound ClpP family serine protease